LAQVTVIIQTDQQLQHQSCM